MDLPLILTPDGFIKYLRQEIIDEFTDCRRPGEKQRSIMFINGWLKSHATQWNNNMLYNNTNLSGESPSSFSPSSSTLPGPNAWDRMPIRGGSLTVRSLTPPVLQVHTAISYYIIWKWITKSINLFIRNRRMYLHCLEVFGKFRWLQGKLDAFKHVSMTRAPHCRQVLLAWSPAEDQEHYKIRRN